MKTYGNAWQELRALIATALISAALRVHGECTIDNAVSMAALRNDRCVP